MEMLQPFRITNLPLTIEISKEKNKSEIIRIKGNVKVIRHENTEWSLFLNGTQLSDYQIYLCQYTNGIQWNK
jgi:uncharacterized protein (UPF0216 family)